MKTTETNCLESILDIFFNKGKRQKLFLSKPKRGECGIVIEPFTKIGGRVYKDFTEFCYEIENRGIKTLGDLKNLVKSLENIGIGDNDTFNDIVETTDIICSEEG